MLMTPRICPNCSVYFTCPSEVAYLSDGSCKVTCPKCGKDFVEPPSGKMNTVGVDPKGVA